MVLISLFFLSPPSPNSLLIMKILNDQKPRNVCKRKNAKCSSESLGKDQGREKLIFIEFLLHAKQYGT